MAEKKPSGFDFEAAMEELEKLVTAMEEGSLSLEDSLAAFEKGVKLARRCQTALKEAEQKVQRLLDGSGKTGPLDPPQGPEDGD